MTTDDIARILAALHDITPEKVRAVIEGAEKLRGLTMAASPSKLTEPAQVTPPTPKQIEPKRASAKYARNGTCVAIHRFLQSRDSAHIQVIADAVGSTYAKTSSALTLLCRSGRAERASVGIYRAGKNETPPLSAPGRPPKEHAAPRTKTPQHPPLPPPTEPRKRTIPAAPFITKHARERWAEHHDDTSNEAILTSYTHGIEIDAGIAAQVTNVARRGAGDSTYRLSPDRRGIFVVADNLGSKALVTYLRLTERHVEWFLENYPVTGQNATAH